MKFYTNVQMVGDKFLVRGYEDGKHFMVREEFHPTLFVPSKKKTKYKTLEGEYVQAVKPGTVRDCRDFFKQYDSVDGFEIYGNERYIYQYIADKYPEEEIKFDISKIRLLTIDIETRSENGFPDVESADQEILLITIHTSSSTTNMTCSLTLVSGGKRTCLMWLLGGISSCLTSHTWLDALTVF
jgi:hypothetical protein